MRFRPFRSCPARPSVDHRPSSALTCAVLPLLLVVFSLAVPSPSPAAADEPAAVEAAADRPPERQLDWSLGAWKGLRKNPVDGTGAPMMVRGTKFLGGSALVSEVEVHHRDGTVSRDLVVQALDPQTGVWVEQFVDHLDPRFVRLEADDVSGDRTVWQSAGPDRPRELRIVTERLAADRWRRTSSVSEDGGETWRVVWIDELERVRGF